MICSNKFIPRCVTGKTCSNDCSKLLSRHNQKMWKINNPEKNRELTNASSKRCRERNPEIYRFCARNRRYLIREASNGISGKIISSVFTLKNWNDMKNEYGNRCAWCWRPGIELTIDHIFPISRGGRHTKENIQPLCRSCNSWKKDRIDSALLTRQPIQMLARVT